ncbi:MAG: thymidylate synthase [Candidatus Nomurabacteria bacterium]|jgi:thymidylate synthase|nr:thymidylate synthase [Candidatus Nomurabacteria bacterium]
MSKSQPNRAKPNSASAVKIHPEYQYLRLLARILKDGKSKKSRGIANLKSVFGAQLSFDLRYGFPLLTTKKTPFKWPLHEMLWFISGDCTTPKYLQDHKVNIWDGFEDPTSVSEGTLGRIYGVQWRHWRKPCPHQGSATEIDQLAWAIEQIKHNPDSKAIIVSGWNAGELDEMRLPPCHTLFQFDVIKGKLYLHLFQRSSDVFLGLPFNICQYAALLMMVAKITGLEARELVISISDAHLYDNQLAAAREQLTHKPYKFPKLVINGNQKTIDDFKIDDFELQNYESHPQIKVPTVIV